MSRSKSKPRYRRLAVSVAISVLMLVAALQWIDTLTASTIIDRLLWPLSRLLLFISIGLVVGQLIEASGWTRSLASLTAPVFKFGNLGPQCGAAFTAAFFSGVAANAMLLDFYQEGKICKQELFLSNFINQLPAYFLHLPTTVFIVIPLTGWAGALYFLITFAAVLLRTGLLLLYGHFRPAIKVCDYKATSDAPPAPKRGKQRTAWEGIKARFPSRMTNVAMYVVPIYILVFLVNAMGFFDLARQWLAGFVVTSFMPMEALSLVILSFAAEFTSGFAAAGALLEAGVITVKQTAIALLVGNIIAFPIRALRHQLPRYIGIFSPKMGTQLLVMGQGLRVSSLIAVGLIYYVVG